MKKLLVLFVALAVASTAFAADFSFSWDTDFGWASNFDDSYESYASELELAIAADIDEYNSLSTEFENVVDTPMYVGWNSVKITTDLGAYLGLSGVDVSWVNGITDPGDEEYSDVLRVGLQNNGLALGLTKDAVTDLNLDFGAFWASVAANWNLAGADETRFTGGYNKEMQFIVGAVDLVPGLSFEVGVELEDLYDATAGAQAEETIVATDAAYVMPMDAVTLTVAGSFANFSEAGTQAYGAGLGFGFDVDNMTALDASVEFAGDDDEALRILGGGLGLTYADYGFDADLAYAMGIADYQDADGVDADGDLLGIDLSGYVEIGAAQFRVGYAVTDFGWSNNSGVDVPTEGGAYMRLTADF